MKRAPRSDRPAPMAQRAHAARAIGAIAPNGATCETGETGASCATGPVRPGSAARPTRSQRGFTLIEVLVALGIVAIALAAGTQATSALVRNLQHASDAMLGQLCAENAMTRARLSRQMPAIGATGETCVQASTEFRLTVTTSPTLNPNFRRVDVQVRDVQEAPVLRLSTVVGRY